MTIKSSLKAACAATLLFQVPHLIAQDATPTPAPSATAEPGTSPAPSGAPDHRGGTADFRQRMNDRIKAELKASDDEWSVIQPLLEKVQTAQRATMMGRFSGGGRRGGRGPGSGGNPDGGSPSASPAASTSPQNEANRPGRVSSPEADALRAALESESTSSDEIKTKLQALRDARQKATADLQTARESLKKVLTLRQEATLVEMGILD